MEREVALREIFPPPADERLLLVEIALALVAIRFALIPQRAFDRHLHDGMDHRVIHHAHFTLGPRRSGHGRRRRDVEPGGEVLPRLRDPVLHLGQHLGQLFLVLRVQYPQPFRRSPRLDPGAAPVGVHEADRHPGLLENLSGKIETRRRESRDRRRRTHLPRRVSHSVGLRSVGLGSPNLDVPDFGKVRGLHVIGRRNLPHCPLHVRLPAADPDVAHDDVLQSDAVLAGDGHLQILALLERRQFHFPRAIRVGFCRGGLS